MKGKHLKESMASFKFGSGIANANTHTPKKLSPNLTGTMACIKHISHKQRASTSGSDLEEGSFQFESYIQFHGTYSVSLMVASSFICYYY
jgi:hypothetical protein